VDVGATLSELGWGGGAGPLTRSTGSARLEPLANEPLEQELVVRTRALEREADAIEAVATVRHLGADENDAGGAAEDVVAECELDLRQPNERRLAGQADEHAADADLQRLEGMALVEGAGEAGGLVAGVPPSLLAHEFRPECGSIAPVGAIGTNGWLYAAEAKSEYNPVPIAPGSISATTAVCRRFTCVSRLPVISGMSSPEE
jgi:hypothetical protein